MKRIIVKQTARHIFKNLDIRFDLGLAIRSGFPNICESKLTFIRRYVLGIYLSDKITASTYNRFLRIFKKIESKEIISFRLILIKN